MKKQLDEHLAAEEVVLKSRVGPLVKGLVIYFLLIGICGVLFYYLMESGPFNAFEAGNVRHNMREEIVRFFFVSSIFFLAGHVLQNIINETYHKAVVRSAIVPVLFWNVFLTISLIQLFFSEPSSVGSLWEIIGAYLGVNTWLLSLSLFISWYFVHQKKWLYALCFVAHWLVSGVITGFLVS